MSSTMRVIQFHLCCDFYGPVLRRSNDSRSKPQLIKKNLEFLYRDSPAVGFEPMTVTTLHLLDVDALPVWLWDR